MKSFSQNNFFQKYFFVLSFFTSSIIILFFLITIFELSFQLKIISLFVSIILLIAVNYFVFKNLEEKSLVFQTSDDYFSDDFEEKLLLLEEASNSFALSLNTNDLFNLLAGRIGEIIHFKTAILFLKEKDSKSELIASNVFGEGFQNLQNFKIKVKDGFIGNSFSNKIACFDNDLSIEKSFFPVEFLECGLAVPLEHKSEVFGILALFRNENFLESDKKKFEAIGNRISSAFQNSNNLERNLHTALTDSLTGFANERAFYLILEQQIAEAERFQELRPLTLISLDLASFDEINLKLGYAIGDQVLIWTAKLIKNQLRKMDVLARIIGDEFLVILPTASEDVTEKIAKRISSTIENNPFIHTDSSKIKLKLNIGTATYKTNFDTAQSLVKNALSKKEFNKLPANSTVILFPKAQ
jgi:diguanylate cyclase (GGDEF)-like protein